MSWPAGCQSFYSIIFSLLLTLLLEDGLWSWGRLQMRTEMKGGGESVRARLKGVIKVDVASVLGRFSCCGSQPITWRLFLMPVLWLIANRGATLRDRRIAHGREQRGRSYLTHINLFSRSPDICSLRFAWAAGAPWAPALLQTSQEKASSCISLPTMGSPGRCCSTMPTKASMSQGQLVRVQDKCIYMHVIPPSEF